MQVYNNELEYNDDTIKINIIDQTESRYKSLRRYRLQCDLSRFCLSCLGPLVYCIQKFKLFGFPIFPYWGRFFQKRIGRSKFDIYVFIYMYNKIIESMYFDRFDKALKWIYKFSKCLLYQIMILNYVLDVARK